MSSYNAGVIFGIVLGGVGTLILIGLVILRGLDQLERGQRIVEDFDAWERELGQ